MPSSSNFAPTGIGQVGDTGVYRIDLSILGIATISSITIYDDNYISGGTGGASGFDLDFVRLSNSFTSSASTAASLASLNVFNFSSGVDFSPGYLRPWRRGEVSEWNTSTLFGTTGANVFSAGMATLDIRDAVDNANIGAVSIGEGGRITFTLNQPLSTAGLYFYYGDVGGGNDNSSVSVSTDARPARPAGVTLVGTASSDTIELGSGINVHVGAGNDVVDGSAGDDFLNGGGGNDQLIGGAGADYLNGGTGFNFASYVSASAAVYASLLNRFANTGDAFLDRYESIQGLIGSSFSDILVGDQNFNALVGNNGDDVLYGFGGRDELYGGNGTDQLYGGDGADFLDGSDGLDYARYDYSPAAVVVRLDSGVGLNGDAQGDILTGIEGLAGSSDRDFLIGDAAGNILLGLQGNDWLYGQGGGDQLRGGLGSDQILGGAGADFMFGDEGNDQFWFLRADMEPGVFDTILDFGQSANNFDYLRFEGIGASDMIVGQNGTDTVITTAELYYSGGIIIRNFSSIDIIDQLIFA